MSASEGESLAESQGIALKVIARNENLPYQLLLGHAEGTLAQGGGAQVLQFTAHQPLALLNLALVATEIYAPYAGILVAEGVALYIIDQSVLLAQTDVEQRVHARSAQYVVEQEEGRAVVVVHAVPAVAHQHVGLVGIAFASHIVGLIQGQRLQGLLQLASLQHGGVLLHLLHYLAEIHLTQHEERGIVGHIVFACKAQRIGSLVFAQPVGLAQYVAPQSVAAE